MPTQSTQNHIDIERKTRFLIERIVQIEMEQKNAQSQLSELSSARRKFEEDRRRLRDENEARKNSSDDEHFSQELATLIQHKETEYLRLKENIDSIKAQITQEAKLLESRLDTFAPEAPSMDEEEGSTPPEKGRTSSRAIFSSLVGIVTVAIFISAFMYVVTIREASEGAPKSTLSSHQEGDAQDSGLPKRLVAFRDPMSNGEKGPSMLIIAAGEFMMGSLENPDRLNEQPAHRRSIKEFAISRLEITKQDYNLYAEENNSQPESNLGAEGETPVVNVSWEDAIQYTQWLSDKTGKNYRLPTESEWEYAAGAGSQSEYWWGDEPEKDRAVCKDCMTDGDGVIANILSPYPGNSLPENTFGLSDMAGNVMEWTLSCYQAYQDAPELDALEEMQRDCPLRVARGGSFQSELKDLRTRQRFPYAENSRVIDLGFRVVREIE